MRALGTVLGLVLSLVAAYYAGMIRQREVDHREAAIVASRAAGLAATCLGQWTACTETNEDARQLLRFYRGVALGCGLQEDEDTRMRQAFVSGGGAEP